VASGLMSGLEIAPQPVHERHVVQWILCQSLVPSAALAITARTPTGRSPNNLQSENIQLPFPRTKCYLCPWSISSN
jgi:hypothetical protein